jgi:hypothetical protein
MPRPRILTQLALYAVALLAISGVAFFSVNFLAGSLNALAPGARKIEAQTAQDNVPLPRVIVPETPVLERPISRPARESSFATVAPPSLATETAVGPPAESESIVTLGMPTGQASGDP